MKANPRQSAAAEIPVRAAPVEKREGSVPPRPAGQRRRRPQGCNTSFASSPWLAWGRVGTLGCSWELLPLQLLLGLPGP